MVDPQRRSAGLPRGHIAVKAHADGEVKARAVLHPLIDGNVSPKFKRNEVAEFLQARLRKKAFLQRLLEVFARLFDGGGIVSPQITDHLRNRLLDHDGAPMARPFDQLAIHPALIRVFGPRLLGVGDETFHRPVGFRGDGGGEIGVIASVTQPFCGNCSRMRLSPEGQIFTCLFATQGTDLKTPLRDGASDDEIEQIIRDTWGERIDRYSEERTSETASREKVEMYFIGG